MGWGHLSLRTFHDCEELDVMVSVGGVEGATHLKDRQSVQCGERSEDVQCRQEGGFSTCFPVTGLLGTTEWLAGDMSRYEWRENRLGWS